MPSKPHLAHAAGAQRVEELVAPDFPTLFACPRRGTVETATPPGGAIAHRCVGAMIIQAGASSRFHGRGPRMPHLAEHRELSEGACPRAAVKLRLPAGSSHGTREGAGRR